MLFILLNSILQHEICVRLFKCEDDAQKTAGARDVADEWGQCLCNAWRRDFDELLCAGSSVYENKVLLISVLWS